jgi:hypothetical protein
MFGAGKEPEEKLITEQEKVTEPPKHEPWTPLFMPAWMETLPLSAKLRELDNGVSRIGLADAYNEDGAVHWANNTRMYGRRIYLGALTLLNDQSWMWTWSWAMDAVQNELIVGVDKLPKRVSEIIKSKEVSRATAQRVELLLQQPFILTETNNSYSAACLGAMLLGAEYMYLTFPPAIRGRADVYAILERWD